MKVHGKAVYIAIRVKITIFRKISKLSLYFLEESYKKFSFHEIFTLTAPPAIGTLSPISQKLRKIDFRKIFGRFLHVFVQKWLEEFIFVKSSSHFCNFLLFFYSYHHSAGSSNLIRPPISVYVACGFSTSLVFTDFSAAKIAVFKEPS